MANKMGYIFPKRIRDAMSGDSTPFGSKFYMGGLTPEEKKKFQEERNVEQFEKLEKQKEIQKATIPWNCSVCGKMMTKKLDKKYNNRRGMCMDCTILAETQLRILGKFDAYEKSIALRNYKAWLIDVKEQAEDFLSNLKEETKIVNHDGSFDTIKNDTTIVKKFISTELDEINNKLKEVEDIDMSKSAEEELGINLKDIVLEYHRNRENRIELT